MIITSPRLIFCRFRAAAVYLLRRRQYTPLPLACRDDAATADAGFDAFARRRLYAVFFADTLRHFDATPFRRRRCRYAAFAKMPPHYYFLRL